MALTRYLKEVGSPSTPIYRYVAGWRQKPFVNQPLPVRSEHVIKTTKWTIGNNPPTLPSAIAPRTMNVARTAVGGIDPNSLGYSFGPTGIPNTILVDQKAYRKFTTPITDQDIDLGVYFGEMGETFDMIADRVHQYLSAWKKFRKAKSVGQAIRVLRRTFGPPPSRKAKQDLRPYDYRPIKDAGSLWLEYWFGWAPLVNDIYKGCEMLSKGLMIRHFSNEASGQRLQGRTTYGTLGDFSMRSTEDMTGFYLCRYQAEIVVTSPNLHLAQRLGLTNPAAVAWELVPFSFLVDWFVNVGDVVASWDPLVGVTPEKAFNTRYMKGTVEYHRELYNRDSPSIPGLFYQAAMTTHTFHFLERKTGIAPPTVKLRLDWPQLSRTRAATSISLLVQHLGRKSWKSPE